MLVQGMIGQGGHLHQRCGLQPNKYHESNKPPSMLGSEGLRTPSQGADGLIDPNFPPRPGWQPLHPGEEHKRASGETSSVGARSEQWARALECPLLPEASSSFHSTNTSPHKDSPWSPVQPLDQQTPRPIPGPTPRNPWNTGHSGKLTARQASLPLIFSGFTDISNTPLSLLLPTAPHNVATVHSSLLPSVSQALSANTSLQVMETLTSEPKILFRSEPTVQAVQG